MEFNAYHFTGDKLRDGSAIPVIGEPLVYSDKIEICRSGLHASRKVWQALKYAPGHKLHRVLCEDIHTEHDDKFVCSKRTIVATIDAEKLLWDFARSCARDVLHLWDAPDVVAEYLETGNDDLRAAARDAAWAAVRDAVRDAAWAAAWDAAWAAARDAAWAAAWAAARDAAWAAAWDAAWAAAWAAVEKKQRQRLTRMANKAFDEASK
jgi:hypothetical protein